MESSQNFKARQRTRFVSCLLFFLMNVIAYGQLRINEVLLNNYGTKYDENGNHYPYIELKNVGTQTLSLNNYCLTNDNVLKPLRFQLPDIQLHSNEYLLVFLSNLDYFTPEIHASFELKPDEMLYLNLVSNGLVSTIDSVLPTNEFNISWGRNENISSDLLFYYQIPSPKIVNNSSNTSLVNKPIISIPNGLGTIGENVFFSGQNVRYSLNSSEILNNSLTGNSFSLPNPYASSAFYSFIPTNPSLVYPKGEYTQSRADNRGWRPPFGTVDRIQIIRARSFNSDLLPSFETVRSIITQLPNSNLPILSIITDSLGFFNEDEGIYVFGNDSLGNYTRYNDNGERLVHLHFFDKDGNFEFENTVGAKIKGNGSRHSAQKSLKFRYRENMPYPRIDYKNFILNYSLLRGSGHRPDCITRDVLGQLFIKNFSFVSFFPKSYDVFLNGEYWGMFDFRGDLKEDYIGLYYGLPEKQIALADHTFLIENKNRLNVDAFSELTLFCENNDLNLQENFSFVEKQLDIPLFIDLYAAQIYLGNGDFPRTNVSWFNVENDETTSKWRSNVFDLDAAFGGSCDEVYKTFNALDFYLQTSSGNWLKSTRLLRNLLERPQFIKDFCNKMADRLNTDFHPSELIPIFSEYKNSIQNVREKHVNRWGYPSSVSTLVERYDEIPSLVKWNQTDSLILDYLNNRSKYVYRHFMNKFLLSDTHSLTLEVNDFTNGTIQINSIFLSDSTSGIGNDGVFPWKGTYFQSVPVSLKAIAKKGFRFVDWSNGETNSTIQIVLDSDSSITANFISDSFYELPWLNEVQVSNASTFSDDFAQFVPWVELYNKNSYPISLEGMFITDSLTNPTKFSFSSFSEHSISENGYQVFFFSGEKNRGKNHLFTLTNGNTKLFLIDSDGQTVLQEITLPSSSTNNSSFGSLPNASVNFSTYNSPTPLANNDLTGLNEIESSSYSITVYPNPSSGKFYFDKKVSVQLFSLDGRKLLQVESSFIDISTEAKGMYLLKTEVGQAILIEKQ